MRHTISSLLVCSLVFVAVGRVVAQSSLDPVFDAKGLQPNRVYVSELPIEHFDPVTGSMVITFTDLVLPGNGGRDLRFQRTYNSKGNSDVGSWIFGLEGIVLATGDGYWPDRLDNDPGPTLYTSDGGEHLAAMQLYSYPGNLIESRRIMMTDGFWTFYRCTTTQTTPCSSRKLWMPDGSVTEYEGGLTRVKDSFGQEILTLQWSSTGTTLTITQHLGNSPDRAVVIQCDAGSYCVGAPGAMPTSMTLKGATPAEDRTWRYAGGGVVTPPVGPSWGLDASASGNGTWVLTTPHGGRVEYDFEQKILRILGNGQFQYTRVLTERRAYERGGTPVGTWKYRHGPEPLADSLERDVEVEAPDNVITTFTVGHATGGCTNTSVLNVYPSRGEGVKQRSVYKAGQELEREVRAYECVSMLPGSPANGGLPELTSRTITREPPNGPKYKTTFIYSGERAGDFHNPSRIEEAGESDTTSRTTARTFLHTTNAPFSGPYLLGMLTQETVSVGDQSFTKSWDPSPANGFIRSETIYGITTTFTPTPDNLGNVGTATNANNKTTSFTYEWGRVKNTNTPEYLIERTINPDGTVATEKSGDRTTAYVYDALSRIKEVHPPAGGDAAANTIYTDYDNEGGAWVRTKHGEGTASYSQVVTTVDGFGRPVATDDNANVHTRTEYDAEGRVKYQGMPFTPGVDDGDVGTTIQYDGLGRVLLERHSDNTFRQYAYSGNTLTVTDENGNGHSTVITREAFGNPDEVRVTRVKDAKQNEWSYEYNAVGSLEKVTAPNSANGTAVVREWTHDSRNLLLSEKHPESGTVLYTDYYPNGTLWKKVDANQNLYTFEYDGNDRLKKVTIGNDVTTITYEPGSDNRWMMTAPDVLTTFLYDAAGRLKKRTDTIGGAVFDSWFTYDGNGNLETLTYPSGRRIQYIYTLENRLREIRNDNANQVYASTFEYHPSGAVKKYQSGNNVVTEIGYDKKRYWANDIKIGSLRHFKYSEYDNVGNVKRIEEDRAGVNMNQSFTYDEVDRLATANGFYGPNSFSYDAHGNRQDNMVYSQQNPFLLQSFNGLQVIYDDNGNLRFGPGVQYDYTRGSVLERSVVGGTQTRYRYDGDDWRVKKEVIAGGNAPPTYFVRGPNGQLLTEWRNSSPNPEVRDFIYAGSRLIAAIKTTSLQPK